MQKLKVFLFIAIALPLLNFSLINKSKEPIPDGMVLVEGGSFKMGAEGEPAQEDESPIHKVTVSSFYMDIYEVTIADFEKFVNETKYITESEKDGFVNDYDEELGWVTKEGINWRYDSRSELIPKEEYNRPVTNVSWNDAAAYALWKGKRLPTEAELEYATKGGNKSKDFIYCGSNNIDEVAWYETNSGNKTHKVGQKLPNELGIYDLAGNAWEWCSDYYDGIYYSTSPEKNPLGPETGDTRCIRGGSFESTPEGMRNSGYRNNQAQDIKFYTYGFRCVQDTEKKEKKDND